MIDLPNPKEVLCGLFGALGKPIAAELHKRGIGLVLHESDIPKLPPTAMQEAYRKCYEEWREIEADQ